MNRIYRTLWNAVRQSFVVANEKTGVSQSRGSELSRRGGQETSNLTVAQSFTRSQPAALKKAIAGVFVCLLALPALASILPTDCSSLGGTFENAVCTFKGLRLYISNLDSVWNLSSGDLQIEGGSSSSHIYGISLGASGSGNSAVIRNTGNGTLSIKAGAVNVHCYGISIGSQSGGKFVLENSGKGNIIIQGNKVHWSLGVSVGSSGKGSVTSFINSGNGHFSIQGMEASDHGYGIYTGASDSGTLEIRNTGKGLYTIQAGNYNGINNLASSGQAVIYNGLDSTMEILGSNSCEAINLLRSDNGSATITNAGTMIMNAKAIGSFGGANSDGSKSFVNESTGLLKAEIGTLFTGGTISKATSNITNFHTLVLPDGTTTTVSGQAKANVYKSSGTWTLKSDWRSYASFQTGSTILFSNLTAGMSGAEDIRNKFNAAFGTGVNVVFAEPELLEEESIGSSIINDVLSTNEGAVFIDKGFNSTNDKVVIGDSGDIPGSIGFKKLDGASQVQVIAGKKFTLLGDGTIATNAAVTLENGSEMDLGSLSKAVSAQQGGSIGTITNHGSLNVRKGKFTTDSVSGSGSLLVDEEGDLISISSIAMRDAKVCGKLTSAGGFTATDKVSVAHGGRVKAGVVKAINRVQTAGLLQASNVQSRELSIDRTGTLVVDKLGDKLNQTVVNSGVVLATSASNVGMVQLQSGSSLIVGAGNIEAYYLMNLDTAKEVYENGGTLSQTVINALVSAGKIVDPAALPAEAAAGAEDAPAIAALSLSDDAAEPEAAVEEAVIVEAEATPTEMSEDNASDAVTLAEVEPAHEEITNEPQIIITRSMPDAVQSLIRTAGTLYEAERLSSEAHGMSLEHALSAGSDSGGLWVQSVYSKTDTDAFESDTAGFAFGAEGSIGDVRLGAAFTAQRGDAGAVIGSNDIDAYSFTAYAAKPIAWGMNLAGGVTYTHTDNELSAMGWEGKAKTDSVLFGARLVKSFDLGADFTLTPYIGADVGFIRAKGFDIRTAGADPFAVEKESEWYGRIPVGVKADKRFTFSDGFLKVGADASLVSHIGAKTVSHRVKGSDFSEEIADRRLGSLNLTAAYERKNASLTIGYGLTKGTVRDMSHSISAKAEINF